MGTYIGFAKGENDASGTTLNTDTTLNVQVGDVLVGAAMFELGADTTFSFSDTAGSTLTLGTKRTHSGGNLIAQPFILVVTSANTSNTVTFTLGAARQYRSLVVGQYRGLAGTIVDEDFLDVTSGSPSTISTPDLTFGGAGTLVGLFAPYSNNAFTVSAPFTERYDAGSYRVGLFDRGVSSAGNYPATLTQGSVNSLLFGVALEDAPPAAVSFAFQQNAFQFGQYLSSSVTNTNGALNQGIGDVTVSATGRVEIRGIGANNTIGAVTSTATGRVDIRGVGANNTIAAVTSTATGRVDIAGVGANNTIGDVTSSATGKVELDGEASITVGNVTVTATGVVGSSPVTGVLDVGIGAVTSTATGQVIVSGVGANDSIADVTSTATGIVVTKGVLSVSIGDVTSLATGTVRISGVGANNTIGAVTVTATGQVQNRGVGANNVIGDVTSTATGQVQNRGVLSSTISAITSTATGSVENRGALSVTIGAVTSTSTGVVGNFVSGQLNQTIGLFTVTATAGVQNTVRSMGATMKQGTVNGSVHAKPYSKTRFRQESMKWPSKG